MYRIKWMTALLLILAGGCTAPHYIWKQADMLPAQINAPSLQRKLLIASRDSEFKRVLTGRITDAFADRSVYVKIIGIAALAEEDAHDYAAVVIINTAMGWTVDVPVEAFLEKFGQMESIIVLTTADGGDVLPDMQGRNIDAMSSASVMDQAEPLAGTIIAKVERLMD